MHIVYTFPIIMDFILSRFILNIHQQLNFVEGSMNPQSRKMSVLRLFNVMNNFLPNRFIEDYVGFRDLLIIQFFVLIHQL